MSRTILASVPLQRLINDAERQHVPFSQYDFRMAFCKQATRGDMPGGGPLTPEEEVVVEAANHNRTLADIIDRRNELIEPNEADAIYVSLVEDKADGKNIYSLVFTSPPKITYH